MEDVYHVWPGDDLEEHLLKSEELTEKQIVEGEIRGVVVCACSCIPRIVYDENCVIVVHGAFDGREAMEEVEEVLGVQDKKTWWGTTQEN